jgi:hypothetical protein
MKTVLARFRTVSLATRIAAIGVLAVALAVIGLQAWSLRARGCTGQASCAVNIRASRCWWSAISLPAVAARRR